MNFIYLSDWKVLMINSNMERLSIDSVNFFFKNVQNYFVFHQYTVPVFHNARESL